MTYDMMGKVIAVTGASGNIGSGVVKAFAETGARIALIDRDAAKISRLISELGSDTDKYKGLPADLSDPEAVDTVINHIVDHFGGVDSLVHTVGGFAMGDNVHDGNMDTFDLMMTLNVRLTYLVAGKFAAQMLKTLTPGSISLILAKAGKSGASGMAAYTASKAAATRIMESMAQELKANNIRVNGISPSIVDTPPNRNSMPDADFDKWVNPAQIGDLAVFLASNAASAITGTNVEISGKV